MPENLRARLRPQPRHYRWAAWTTLVLLTVVVFTGAAVRLTDSGLGCATWPHCAGGHVYPPDQLHALIEFSNRAWAGLVGTATIAVMVLFWTAQPRRRDLALLATLLPLGVLAQAILGGFTVREKLAPGFVMAHFGLSMLILIPAVALVWRLYHPRGERPRVASRLLVWTVRATVILGAITIFAGTVSTAAGPHSGAHTGQRVGRLHFKGDDTLVWAIHQHATVAILFGLAAIVAWLLKRRELGGHDPLEPITVLAVLIAGQGLVGSVQYEMHLPAEMVWVHVSLATVTWVVALWAWADIGRPSRARAPEPLGDPSDALRPLPEETPELEVVRF